MNSNSSNKNPVGQGGSPSDIMFSQRIVNMDFYSTFPNKELDPLFSEYCRSEVVRVPVLRIYGSTPKGQKTCTHVHGVFPYISVLYDDTIPDLEKKFGTAMDESLNEFLKTAAHKNFDFNKSSAVRHHVFTVVKMSGRTFYGYRHSPETFLRIYFYNPYVIKKAVELLLLGGVLERKFQPYEAHIPYHLQFMIDYNLYGMNLIHFSAVKFRRKSKGKSFGHVSPISSHRRSSFLSNSGVTTVWDPSNIPDSQYSSLERMTNCELEIDVLAQNIVNGAQSRVYSSNPGMEAIWQDEMERRRHLDPESLSDIKIPDSQARDYDDEWFSAEFAHQRFLNEKLVVALSVESESSQSLSRNNIQESQSEGECIKSSQDRLQFPPNCSSSSSVLKQTLLISQQSNDTDDDELMQLFESFMQEKETGPELTKNVITTEPMIGDPLSDEEDNREEDAEEIQQDCWDQSFLSDSMMMSLVDPLFDITNSNSNELSKTSKNNTIFQGDGQGGDSDSDEESIQSIPTEEHDEDSRSSAAAASRRSSRISKRGSEGKVASYKKPDKSTSSTVHKKGSTNKKNTEEMTSASTSQKSQSSSSSGTEKIKKARELNSSPAKSSSSSRTTSPKKSQPVAALVPEKKLSPEKKSNFTPSKSRNNIETPTKSRGIRGVTGTLLSPVKEKPNSNTPTKEMPSRKAKISLPLPLPAAVKLSRSPPRSRRKIELPSPKQQSEKKKIDLETTKDNSQQSQPSPQGEPDATSSRSESRLSMSYRRKNRLLQKSLSASQNNSSNNSSICADGITSTPSRSRVMINDVEPIIATTAVRLKSKSSKNPIQQQLSISVDHPPSSTCTTKATKIKSFAEFCEQEHVSPLKLLISPSMSAKLTPDVKLVSPPFVRIQPCPLLEEANKAKGARRSINLSGTDFEGLVQVTTKNENPKSSETEAVETVDESQKRLNLSPPTEKDVNLLIPTASKPGPKNPRNQKRRRAALDFLKPKNVDERLGLNNNISNIHRSIDINNSNMSLKSQIASDEYVANVLTVETYPQPFAVQTIAENTARALEEVEILEIPASPSNGMEAVITEEIEDMELDIPSVDSVDVIKIQEDSASSSQVESISSGTSPMLKYRSFGVQTVEFEDTQKSSSSCCSHCGSGLVKKKDQATDVTDLLEISEMKELSSQRIKIQTQKRTDEMAEDNDFFCNSVVSEINKQIKEEDIDIDSIDITDNYHLVSQQIEASTSYSSSPLKCTGSTSVANSPSKSPVKKISKQKSPNSENSSTTAKSLVSHKTSPCNSPRKSKSPHRKCSPRKSPIRKRFFHLTPTSNDDNSFTIKSGKSTESYKKLFKKMIRRQKTLSSPSITSILSKINEDKIHLESSPPPDEEDEYDDDFSVQSFYDFDGSLDVSGIGSEDEDEEIEFEEMEEGKTSENCQSFSVSPEDSPHKKLSFFRVKRSASRTNSRQRRMKIRATKLRADFMAPDVFENEFEPLKSPPSYKWAVKFPFEQRALLRAKRVKAEQQKLLAQVKPRGHKDEEDEEGLSSRESTPEKVQRGRGNAGNYSDNDENDDQSSQNSGFTDSQPSQGLTPEENAGRKTPTVITEWGSQNSWQSGGTPKSILRRSSFSSSRSARHRGASGKRRIRWDTDSTGPCIKKIKLIGNEENDNENDSPYTDKSMNLSELDGPSPKNKFGFEHDMSNLQDAKALHQHQYLTLMSLEVHCEARGKLIPDPKFDKVVGIFIYIYNDYPDVYHKPQQFIKCLLLSPVAPKNDCDSSCEYFSTELELFRGFINIFNTWDPDMLVGYEIERFSWGYLINRGMILQLNMIAELSRLLPNPKRPFEIKQHEEWDNQIPGRIVFNLWKLLRHEITVQSYTYENATYHILHRRVCRFGYETLWGFWNQANNRWRVLEYYAERTKGTIELINQLDLINRTSELARLFGILFYEVFSRGSQFRVESMMLRISKSQNFVAVSPSIRQRAQMRAPEFVPLILEPMSCYYTDPVAVLDFQSLYPSMMIAYNYDYSTVIGRVEHLGEDGSFNLGCLESEISPYILNLIRDDIHVSPAGVAFVKPSIRKGILSEMLEQILDTRQMVKRSMKKWKNEGATLQKILDSRQLGLKLIANVSYGYTSANFSGRMPCVEVADSIVSKGRETLQRAIDLVKANYERWGGEVVYGDTDSLFVLFRGKSRQEAFKLGQEIAKEVTQANPKPVKLKFEKIYHPCILQSKKRYVGYSYETEEQEQPTYDAKGIETVRRDGCPAVKKILEKTLHILFTTNDANKVKNFVQLQFKKLFTGRVSMKEYTFARAYRGRQGYKPAACVPALEIAKKAIVKDPRAEPLTKQRVPYVIIYDKPSLPLIKMVRTPMEFANDSTLRLNAHYYIEKAIIPALNRCLSLAKINVSSWYKGLPRKYLRNILEENRAGTLDEYVHHANCYRCDRKTDKGICEKCDKPEQLQQTTSFLIQSSSSIAAKLEVSCQICEICSGDDDKCTNIDCPVFHKILRYERDEHYNRKLLEKLQSFEL